MGERAFLEEIGNLYSINALGTARSWEVCHLRNDSTLPPVMYVIESNVGQEFLLGREMSGRPKFNKIRYLAKSFLELFFEQPKGKELAQYLIHRGAYPFDLQCAFGYTPPTTAGCSQPVSSNSGEFSTRKAVTGRFMIKTSSENIGGKSGWSRTQPWLRVQRLLTS